MKNSLLLFLFSFSIQSFVWSQDGLLDPGFGQGGRLVFGFDGAGVAHDARVAAVQSDGKIVVAGVGFHVPGFPTSHLCVARLLANGSFDPAFSQDGKLGIILDSSATFNSPRAIQILDNGKILMVGSAGTQQYLIRLMPNGDPDASFGQAGVLKIKRPLPNEAVIISDFSLHVLPNGKILTFFRQKYNGLNATIQVLNRFQSNGQADLSFGSGGRVVVDSVATTSIGSFDNVRLALLAGNKMLLVGDSVVQAAPSAIFHAKLMRLNSDGSRDLFFGTGGTRTHPSLNLFMKAVAVDASQNIFMGGMIGGTVAVAKCLPNGALDPAYGAAGVASGGFNFNFINFGLVVHQGKAVAVGLSNAAGPFQTVCKRFDQNGLLDVTFGLGGVTQVPQLGDENVPSGVAIQTDGKVIIVGKRKQTTGTDPSSFEVIRLGQGTSTVENPSGESAFKVYPQPFQDRLWIESEEPVQQVVLYDVQGKIAARQLSPTVQSLELPALPAGLYFLGVFGEKGQIGKLKTVVKN